MSDDPPFPWKQEALRALVAAVITFIATPVLNAAYRVRFAEVGGFIDSLPVPLLLLVIGVFVALSFVFRLARLEKRVMRIVTDCMLIAGLLGLSITVVAALNIGVVPLKSFELTADNIYDAREVPIPQALENISLKVSGTRDPGFPLELERRPPGNGPIDPLVIEGLPEETAVKPGKYYTLTRGEFIARGPLQAGDTLYLHIVNASSFEGKLKLELTGSKNQGAKR
jgi:hypothetical protein